MNTTKGEGKACLKYVGQGFLHLLGTITGSVVGSPPAIAF